MHEAVRRSARGPVGARGRALRLIAIVACAAALSAAVAIPLARRGASEHETITYTELLRALDAGRVAELTIRPGESIRGRWAPLPGRADAGPTGNGSTPAGDASHEALPAPLTLRAGDAHPTSHASFSVVFPLAQADDLLEHARRAGVDVQFEAPPDRERLKTWVAVAIQVLLVGGLSYLVFVHLRGQGGSGKIPGGPGQTVTTFADVAGTQGAAEELREVVEFLRRPSAFAGLGARVPKGVLLVGPPGTGKTLLARAVAGEAGVPFFQISGSEVTGFIVGLGAHRIRTLFKKARKRGGVIFIDELDSLGGRRGRNQSHNEDDRTLNQLLVEMDGFSPSEGVVVIGATNRPEDLDPALKRPGRFDRIVSVPPPTVDGREAILRLHAERRAVPLADDADLGRLARLLPGATGAELANLLNEAAIAAVRDASDKVGWQHLEQARDRLLLGKERVGFRAQEQEWRIVAYHEAGHALAGVMCVPEDGLHKVTIQPRGQAMGVAHFSPEDDRHLYSRRYLEGQIVKGLAGRAAEEVAFGADQVTGGAENDLVMVNRIARKMVYRLGMGRDTGFLVLDGESGPLAADTQARMDDEVRALLERLYARALEIVRTHRAALDALADALLERETLDGDEVLRILARHGVPLAERTADPYAEGLTQAV